MAPGDRQSTKVGPGQAVHQNGPCADGPLRMALVRRQLRFALGTGSPLKLALDPGSPLKLALARQSTKDGPWADGPLRMALVQTVH